MYIIMYICVYRHVLQFHFLPVVRPFQVLDQHVSHESSLCATGPAGRGGRSGQDREDGDGKKGLRRLHDLHFQYEAFYIYIYIVRFFDIPVFSLFKDDCIYIYTYIYIHILYTYIYIYIHIHILPLHNCRLVG